MRNTFSKVIRFDACLYDGHTVPIVALVWDQIALRHEQRKSRITILSDLECPIIAWTQSYTFVTESYWKWSEEVGQALPPEPRHVYLSLTCLIYGSVQSQGPNILYTICTFDCFCYHQSQNSADLTWMDFEISFIVPKETFRVTPLVIININRLIQT